MAVIKRIVVTKGGKVNLGDYQNADRSVTVEAELLPGEDEFEAFDAVSQKAREMLALEVRELVENQLNAADLLGADEDTIRRRVRYAKGFSYLKSVDPEAADMLITDMVSELAAKAEPVEDPFPDYDPDSEDDDYGPDDDDDLDEYDFDEEPDEGEPLTEVEPLPDPDDDNRMMAGEAADAIRTLLKTPVSELDAESSSETRTAPTHPTTLVSELDAESTSEEYPDSTDTPNAGLN